MLNKEPVKSRLKGLGMFNLAEKDGISLNCVSLRYWRKEKNR